MSDDGNGSADRRPTHDEAVRMVLNDPAVRGPLSPLQVRRQELYAEYAGEILADLAEVGFCGLAAVGELYRRRLDYRSAVPVLVSWLPKARYLPLAEEVARALCFSFARQVARPAFLRLFREPPPVSDPLWPATSEPPQEYLRWVHGCGLGVFADASVADEYVELALDRRYGKARGEIVHLPLPRDVRPTGGGGFLASGERRADVGREDDVAPDVDYESFLTDLCDIAGGGCLEIQEAALSGVHRGRRP